MIALMNSGLINVGCPQEGFIVVLENQDGLVVTPATLCRVEPVRPCAEDEFVVVVHGRPIDAGGADRGGCNVDAGKVCDDKNWMAK